MSIAIIAAVLIIFAICATIHVKANLNQRQSAREYRNIFLREASDLVAKPEMPAAHSELLISMANLPFGWATKFTVMRVIWTTIFQKNKGKSGVTLSFDQVPDSLKEKYVVAVLAFALSDSYRSVIAGRLFRASNGWIVDALRHPRPDIKAHATREVIDRVSSMRLRRQSALCSA